MKTGIKIFLVILLIQSPFLYGQRIKDIAYFTGEGSEQLIGYGLVVGLAGSGDSHRSSFTVQSVTSMLKRFGITVPQTDLKTRNVAAVMLTAALDNSLKPGAYFDITVSSMGDATSLQGGVLLLTPLSGLDGKVYAMGQGPISVGGYDVNTSSGNRSAKNHALAGRVPRGGVLKLPVDAASVNTNQVSVFLKEPDYTTANNLINAVNGRFGENTASSKDASEIVIKVPGDRSANVIGFLAELESLPVQTDYAAKVVLNERTGTIVAGNNVIIKPVSITHGSLSLTIKSYPIISQPGAFSGGTTQVVNNVIPYVTQDSTKTVAIQGASNVQEVAAALNSLKVSPRDIISIFQALKEAGALVAELVII